MITGLKRVARWTAAASGMFGVSRILCGRWPRILMYHDFCGPNDNRPGCTRVQTFRQHLAHLTRYYRPLRLRELGSALAAGRAVPARSVVITIDDGYRSFRRWAFPLLREFRVPATVFVVTRFPDTGDWFWTDKLEYVRHRARDAAPLVASGNRIELTELKHMTAAERDQRLHELAERTGIRIPDRAPPACELLSWAELRELVNSGLIDIGSHSQTHALLSTIDPEGAWNEVHGSRQELQQQLGIEVTSFCYPNGLMSDYRPEHVEMVASAGYLCATAAHFGYVTTASQRLALPRVGSEACDQVMFRKRLDGFEYLQQRVRGERCW